MKNDKSNFLSGIAIIPGIVFIALVTVVWLDWSKQFYARSEVHQKLQTAIATTNTQAAITAYENLKKSNSLTKEDGKQMLILLSNDKSLPQLKKFWNENGFTPTLSNPNFELDDADNVIPDEVLFFSLDAALDKKQWNTAGYVISQISSAAVRDQPELTRQFDAYFFDSLARGDIDTSRFLLEHGSNPNGYPLQRVVAKLIDSNNIEAIRFLAQNVSLTYNDNEPLRQAKQLGNKDMIDLLSEN